VRLVQIQANILIERALSVGPIAAEGAAQRFNKRKPAS
jgi:hypothetical protein